MKKTSFLAGALLALAPAFALTIPGCGGGNGGLFPTPTATSMATSTPTAVGTTTPTTNATAKPTTKATATPTPTSAGVTQVSNLTLGNGQRAILTSNVKGTAISGTIQILAAATTKLRAIPFSLTTGTYGYTGTVTTSGIFTINGNFGSFGAFKLIGKLPTATTPGSYTLTVNGQTERGVIPVPGKPFPTPVPTTPGGNYNLVSNLTFSNVSSGSDVVSTPITSFSSLTDGGKLSNLSLNGAKYQSLALNGQSGVTSGNGISRTLSIALFSYPSISNLKPFSVGQVISLSLQSSQIQLAQTSVQGTAFKFGAWRTTSGTATIKAIGTNSATVELNAHFEPTGFGGGKGSFDLKGTATGTGLTVTNTSN